MKIKRRIKYYLLRLFRLNEKPHQIAAGVTIGFVPSWFPTFGFGTLLSVVLAKLARANIVGALVGGLVGGVIWPMLFLLNYQVGSLILDRSPKIDEIEEVDYVEALNHTMDGLDNIRSGGYTFLIGAATNLLISSILLYSVVYFLFKRYRVSFLNKLRSDYTSK